MAFEGIVSGDGPYLSCSLNGGVALGVSGIRHFQPTDLPSRLNQPEPRWWVVKYHDEARILLRGFDRRAVDRLSDEFGLVLLIDGESPPSDRVRQDYFFTSPAWDALCRWVVKHPRLAKARAGDDPYLPKWYGRALAAARVLSA
jgi:hypothetical protein